MVGGGGGGGEIIPLASMIKSKEVEQSEADNPCLHLFCLQGTEA